MKIEQQAEKPQQNPTFQKKIIPTNTHIKIKTWQEMNEKVNKEMNKMMQKSTD